MSDDLWETVDWGDEVVDTSDHHPSLFNMETLFDRKETGATARLSGSSAGSQHAQPSDPSSNLSSKMDACPEMKQHTRDKRGSWFDFEEELERPSRSRLQRNDTLPKGDYKTKRRIKRRQSDFAVQFRSSINQSFTNFLNSVKSEKNEEAVSASALASDDEKLDVPFPTDRRRSCD